MQTIRTTIGRWLEKQEKSWQALSPAKQRSCTLCLFLAYLLLTIGVISKLWYDMAEPDNRMVIDPIDSPVRKKESPDSKLDKLSILVKETIYERK